MKEMESYYEDNTQISTRGCDFWEPFRVLTTQNHSSWTKMHSWASVLSKSIYMRKKKELLRQSVPISRTVFYSTGTEELNPTVTIY